MIGVPIQRLGDGRKRPGWAVRGDLSMAAWKMELSQAQLGSESEVKSKEQKVSVFQGLGLTTMVLVMVWGGSCPLNDSKPTL